MVCPLCRQRRARRACPALGNEICAVCCGTKRLVEVRCPSHCPYLSSAREHPPAVVVRQQRHDMGLLVEFMRDLNTRQSQLFFLVATFLARYRPDELQSLADEDVAEAAGTLAATFETAARGVIYEHPAASIPAGRLATALKAALHDVEQGGGSPFQRDAAMILRRVEVAARSGDAGNPRALLGLLERVIQRTDEAPHEVSKEPRLIVP